jgi:hypothetical protein
VQRSETTNQASKSVTVEDARIEMNKKTNRREARPVNLRT